MREYIFRDEQRFTVIFPLKQSQPGTPKEQILLTQPSGLVMRMDYCIYHIYA